MKKSSATEKYERARVSPHARMIRSHSRRRSAMSRLEVRTNCRLKYFYHRNILWIKSDNDGDGSEREEANGSLFEDERASLL